MFSSFRFPASCALLFLLLAGGCAKEPDGVTLTTPSAGTQRKSETLSSGTWLSARKPLSPPKETSSFQEQSVKIAFLVPLSGRSGALGQEMANAAQLAVFDAGGVRFELMPRDTKGTPEGAAAAVRDAAASGAKLIIGPLFAAEVAAAKPELTASGLSALALSTDVSLAQAGVYVMGFAPAPQVERVVSFALSRGLRRFASVVPRGPYGKLVAEAFETAVRRGGGEIILTAEKEGFARLREKKDELDAIFLPFGGAELRVMAGRLAEAGFETSRVRLLGTGLWDEPDLARDQSLLVGGWYAAAEPNARTKFTRAYQASFGKEPPRLATLAYDATALAAVLAKKGAVMDSGALTHPSGFAGLDGAFRLRLDGQVERNLAVLELTPTGSRVIDPAPSGF